MMGGDRECPAWRVFQHYYSIKVGRSTQVDTKVGDLISAPPGGPTLASQGRGDLPLFSKKNFDFTPWMRARWCALHVGLKTPNSETAWSRIT